MTSGASAPRTRRASDDDDEDDEDDEDDDEEEEEEEERPRAGIGCTLGKRQAGWNFLP